MMNVVFAGIAFMLFLGSNEVKALTVQTDTTEQYSIIGEIRNYGNGWIYLKHGDRLKEERVDSARLVNGRFRFSGKISGIEPFLLGVHYKDSKGKISPSFTYQGPFLLSPGQLYVEGEFDWRSPLIARGNKAQDEYNDFQKKVKLIRDNQKLPQFIKAWVAQSPNSLVSAYIAKSNLITADPDIMKSVYDRFTDMVKESEYGKALQQMIQMAEPTAIGRIAPPFTIPDLKDQLVSLDTVKGTYTLIDFWASWCGPCRAENPHLIKAYDSYQIKGFKIISISMDTDKKLWLKAVDEDKLTWQQFSDLKGMQGEIGKKYGITAIPMNFLIDKDGKIIARNLRGADLIKKLQEVYH